MNCLLTKAFLDHTLQQLTPPKPPRSSHSLCLHRSKNRKLLHPIPCFQTYFLALVAKPVPCVPSKMPSACKMFRTCPVGRSPHPASGHPWSCDILASDLHSTLASWCRVSSAALLLPQASEAMLQTLTGACTHLRSQTPGSSSESNSCSFLLITVLVSPLSPPPTAPPFPAAGSPHSSCPTPTPMGHFTLDSIAILSPL